ncbi:GntR family transcriptional regulator [Streptomyces sp. NPDC007861]|uniref:GntR family transcriptional regulator n=1 Tax=Streptomyces sp. NPDC007861 TaxID=3154893 RepID=UPI0033DB6156
MRVSEQALRLGLLEPGGRLPAAREAVEVVEATAIDPNTVLKAYRELDRGGLVEARHGLGTFVRKPRGAAPAESPLSGEPTDWAARARAAGLERDDVAALCGAVLDEHFTPHGQRDGTWPVRRSKRSRRRGDTGTPGP